MTYDNIDTTRHDELIEDAKGELRIQKVTARTSALTALIFTIATVVFFTLDATGLAGIILTILGSFSALIAGSLLILTIVMFGIGVAGAKHTLERHIRRRNAFVLKQMIASDESSAE